MKVPLRPSRYAYKLTLLEGMTITWPPGATADLTMLPPGSEIDAWLDTENGHRVTIKHFGNPEWERVRDPNEFSPAAQRAKANSPRPTPAETRRKALEAAWDLATKDIEWTTYYTPYQWREVGFEWVDGSPVYFNRPVNPWIDWDTAPWDGAG